MFGLILFLFDAQRDFPGLAGLLYMHGSDGANDSTHDE